MHNSLPFENWCSLVVDLVWLGFLPVWRYFHLSIASDDYQFTISLLSVIFTQNTDWLNASMLPQGASTVHFQDTNAETIRCRAIPNVLANLEQARDRQNRPSESPVTPSRQLLAPNVHFYAGDWEELPTILSVVHPPAAPTNLSFSEDDFMDGCSSHDGSSIVGVDNCPRRSRKLSGSRAWERASETDQADGGYDVILISEVPYAVNSLKKLYALITKVSSSLVIAVLAFHVLCI